MTSRDLVALVHLVGFLTGVLLYGMLAWMSWRSPRDGTSSGAGTLPVWAGALGMLWNAGALVVFGSQDFGFGSANPWLIAVSSSALGLLPAVMLDSATRRPQESRWPTRVALGGYAVSVAACLLEARAAFGSGTSPAGFVLLTLGYGVILVWLLGARTRRVGSSPRALTAVALAAFAVSALHLSRQSGESDSWMIELVGHHASLALVLVVLYQEYRFALADLFLKQALALVMLIAIALGLYAGVAIPLTSTVAGRSPLGSAAVLLTLWTVTALLYPVLRRLAHRVVDRWLLKRADYRDVRVALASALSEARDVFDVQHTVTTTVTGALGATSVAWRPGSGAAQGGSLLVTADGGASATVRVQTSDGPGFELAIGALANGRRLLSDDVDFLERVSLLAARRIDELRVAGERYERELREHEMQRLAAEAELRALRAQLQPHFLFNALTTIGHLVRTSPDRALDTLFQLTALLRAVLRRSARDYVTLRDELQIVDAYLAIEQARFEERLVIERFVPAELGDVQVPPLIVQPLVENAVKHGIATAMHGGTIRIEAALAHTGRDQTLRITVRDTGSGTEMEELTRRRAQGVGLANVERRLSRYFGPRAAMEIDTSPGKGLSVVLSFPVSAPSPITATPTAA